MDLAQGWISPTTEVDRGPVRVEFRAEGVRHELDGCDVGDVAFEMCDPVREFPGWPGKRNYDGHFWMSRSGRSVPFESLVERCCLIELDRMSDVVGVASQPMWIRWGGGAAMRHAPDYFVRLADGRAVVVDVRPTERIDEAARTRFDRTARLCAALGWDFVVFDGISSTREANLRFLMRYRDARWDSTDARMPEQQPGTIAAVARHLGGDVIGLARCYQLLWRGILVADFERTLTLTTPVKFKED